MYTHSRLDFFITIHSPHDELTARNLPLYVCVCVYEWGPDVGSGDGVVTPGGGATTRGSLRCRKLMDLLKGYVYDRVDLCECPSFRFVPEKQ